MWWLCKHKIGLTIKGADFRLETPSVSDYASWRHARMSNEDHLQPFEPTWKPDAFTKATYRRFVGQAEHDIVSDGGAVLLLKHIDTDEVIGGINLRNIRRGSADMGTLGYWMAKEWGGAGRMKLAVGRVCEFGFYQLRLHRIEAACVPENDASAAVLLANGFEEEGFAKAYLSINGAWRDHRLFARVHPNG